MIKKILIPTDFSDCAENAKKTAFNFAQKTGAKLHFLHSVNTIVNWGDMKFLTPKNAILPEDYKEKLFPEVKETMGKIKQRLIDIEKEASELGIQAQSHIVFNHAYREIIDVSSDLQIDLIVMGSHGASGVKEFFIGSNTQKIVRLSPCPVLTVKEEQKGYELKKIVYASDFRDKNVNKNLVKLNELAKLFEAEIQLLFVNTPNNFEDTEFTMSKLKQIANSYDLENYSLHVYNDYSVEDGIIKYCQLNNTDLLTITVHGFKGLRRLVNNNITELLVNHIDVPVLSFNLEK